MSNSQPSMTSPDLAFSLTSKPVTSPDLHHARETPPNLAGEPLTGAPQSRPSSRDHFLSPDRLTSAPSPANIGPKPGTRDDLAGATNPSPLQTPSKPRPPSIASAPRYLLP